MRSGVHQFNVSLFIRSACDEGPHEYIYISALMDGSWSANFFFFLQVSYAKLRYNYVLKNAEAHIMKPLQTFVTVTTLVNQCPSNHVDSAAGAQGSFDTLGSAWTHSGEQAGSSTEQLSLQDLSYLSRKGSLCATSFSNQAHIDW